MKLGNAARATAEPATTSMTSHQHLCDVCGELWWHQSPGCPQQPFVMDCQPCSVTWGEGTDAS